MAEDTIFALSSGAPPAAIGVIRMSGPDAGTALSRMTGGLPPPRHAVLRNIRHPGDGRRLDRALALWFPGPGTATGEDLAELHIHGGRAVAHAVLAALGTLPGLVPAAPGAFTRRAFANGVIDLAEAEGLADLLAAETEAQRRAALDIVGGALGRRIEAWRGRLLDAAAQIEALLDHADEGDVTAAEEGPREAFRVLACDIGQLADQPSTERLRDGVRVVIAGPPNAGKSSLLNALAERDVAIVAEIPGTTRDRIEAPVAIGSQAFVLIDTAGLRDGQDMIERAGIARANEAVAAADVVLWLGAVNDMPAHDNVINIQAKADQLLGDVDESAGMLVSAKTGAGLDALRAALQSAAAAFASPPGEPILNLRQRHELHAASIALNEAVIEPDLLLAAEHARAASRRFDRVTGRAGVEDMLDSLFARFCIGK